MQYKWLVLYTVFAGHGMGFSHFIHPVALCTLFLHTNSDKYCTIFLVQYHLYNSNLAMYIPSPWHKSYFVLYTVFSNSPVLPISPAPSSQVSTIQILRMEQSKQFHLFFPGIHLVENGSWGLGAQSSPWTWWGRDKISNNIWRKRIPIPRWKLWYQLFH